MVITEVINGMIVVVYAKAFEKPDYQEIIDVAFSLEYEYKITKDTGLHGRERTENDPQP